MGVASDYRLHIDQVEEGDLGKYVCHVTNAKGEASTEITLTGRCPGVVVVVVVVVGVVVVVVVVLLLLVNLSKTG